MYLFGPPGAGKSTLMAGLTALCDRAESAARVPHDVLIRDGRPVGAEMGRRRSGFPGTDALSMSIQPEAIRWVQTAPFGIILGEGARLATRGFLKAAEDAGYRVHPLYLDAPEDVMAERRVRRGSNQNAKWIKGATTRAMNLCEAVSADIINANQPTEQMVEDVVKNVPVLGVFL